MTRAHKTNEEVEHHCPFCPSKHHWLTYSTEQEVEGVLLRHVQMKSSRRIPWCDSCNRLMFQFLATYKHCPRNAGNDIRQLAERMDCTHPGFEEVVWPKIKTSLKHKLQELDESGQIVIYLDQEGIEQAHWPSGTQDWTLVNWDGKRDCQVDRETRQKLRKYGTLEDTGRGRAQRAPPRRVFEPSPGRRDDRRLSVRDFRRRSTPPRRSVSPETSCVFEAPSLADVPDGAATPSIVSASSTPRRETTLLRTRGRTLLRPRGRKQSQSPSMAFSKDGGDSDCDMFSVRESNRIPTPSIVSTPSSSEYGNFSHVGLNAPLSALQQQQVRSSTSCICICIRVRY